MSGEVSETESSANSGQGGGVQATLFTQEQVNHFNAEAKRGALGNFFKDLGFDSPPNADDLKSALTKASEFDKLQEGQKSDVERLTGELKEVSQKAEQLSVLESQLTQARVAAELGLKPRYWKYIEGATEEEIKTSVQDILKDVRGEAAQDEPESQEKQGSSVNRRLEPNPQQGRAAGSPPSRTLSAGAEAYKAKHKKE